MIRSATKQDIPDIRKICRNALTRAMNTSIFLEKCHPKHTLVYERGGKAVSVLHTMSISYISSSRTRGNRNSYPESISMDLPHCPNTVAEAMPNRL